MGIADEQIAAHSGAARVVVRHGIQTAECQSPIPALPSVPDRRTLGAELARPCLEMSAWPGAVPCARHHARQVVWDAGLKELIEPVELVVSEIVTNAIRACGAFGSEAAVRLWLAVAADSVLVMVWDASACRPQRQSSDPDAEAGRGLLLVDALSASWGSFELAGEPGKVVWALCSS
jgi:hypothetical protein